MLRGIDFSEVWEDLKQLIKTGRATRLDIEDFEGFIPDPPEWEAPSEALEKMDKLKLKYPDLTSEIEAFSVDFQDGYFAEMIEKLGKILDEIDRLHLLEIDKEQSKPCSKCQKLKSLLT